MRKQPLRSDDSGQARLLILLGITAAAVVVAGLAAVYVGLTIGRNPDAPIVLPPAAPPQAAVADRPPAETIPAREPTPLDRALAETIAALAELNRILETVRDAESARQTLPQVQALAAQYQASERRFMTLLSGNSSDSAKLQDDLRRLLEIKKESNAQIQRLLAIPGASELAKAAALSMVPSMGSESSESAASGYPLTIWNAKWGQGKRLDVEYRVDKPELFDTESSIYWVIELGPGTRRELDYTKEDFDLQARLGALSGVYEGSIFPGEYRTWLEAGDPNYETGRRRAISNVVAIQGLPH